MLSYWEQSSFTHYDYIVVGGGIVGLSTAASLKEQHPTRSVLVLERGVFPTGASTKNAGFACFGSLTELLSDLSVMSASETAAIVESRWRGLEALRKRLGDAAIDFKNYGAYELISAKELPALQRIDEVNQLLYPLFKQQVFGLKSEKIPDFAFNNQYVKELVYNPLEGQIDTGKMMKALSRYTAALGVDLLTGCEVTRLQHDDNLVEVRVQLPNQHKIDFTANAVGVCTNAFTAQLIDDLDIEPGRGQVLVTRPINGLPFQGAFHFDEGYYYFRNIGDRVIFGGGRNIDFDAENTTDIRTTERIRRVLIEKLHNIIFPSRKVEVDYFWAGIMAFGKTKQPIIQFHTPRVVLGVRMGGMGVAIGTNVGKEVALRMNEAW